MTHPWLVYLLSISGGMSAAFLVLGIGGVIMGALVYGASHDRNNNFHEACAKSAARWILPPAVLFLLLSAAMPSQDSVLKAYLMVEGSQLVTADNASTAAKDISAKIDKLIDGLTKKEPEKP